LVYVQSITSKVLQNVSGEGANTRMLETLCSFRELFYRINMYCVENILEGESPS